MGENEYIVIFNVPENITYWILSWKKISYLIYTFGNILIITSAQ